MQTMKPSTAKVARLASIASALHAHVVDAGLECASAVVGKVNGTIGIAVLDMEDAASSGPDYLEDVTKHYSAASEQAKEELLALAAQGLLKAPILAFAAQSRGITVEPGSPEQAEVEARLASGDTLEEVQQTWTVFIMDRATGAVASLRLEGEAWHMGTLGAAINVVEGGESAPYDLPGALRAQSDALQVCEEALLDDIVKAMGGEDVEGSDEYKAKMAEAAKRLKADGVEDLSDDEKLTNGPRVEIVGLHAVGKGKECPALVWTSGGRRHVLLLGAKDVANLLTDILKVAKELPAQLLPALVLATATLTEEMPGLPDFGKFVPDSLKAKLGIKREDAPEGEGDTPVERFVEALFRQHKPGKSDDADTPSKDA